MLSQQKHHSRLSSFRLPQTLSTKSLKVQTANSARNGREPSASELSGSDLAGAATAAAGNGKEGREREEGGAEPAGVPGRLVWQASSNFVLQKSGATVAQVRGLDRVRVCGPGARRGQLKCSIRLN